MGNIWFISDTHFGHENILTFTKRDGTLLRNFSSVQEMDETMIDRWNEVVQDGDKVYHLGDVFFGDKVRFKRNWSRLRGKKRLIVGNHDDIKLIAREGFFKEIYMWRKVPGTSILLTHVPVHQSTLMEPRFDEVKMVNVHGHIHANKSPDGPYHCVCVEQTDFRPVHVDEISY